MKYVSPLTEDEMRELEELRKSGLTPRIRDRAHCVLLSAKGYKIDRIADIFGADRRTVSSWIDSWEESGFHGLPDSPRGGRPPKLTEEEKRIAEELIKENPRSLKAVITKLAETTGKTVSIDTVRRLAKKADRAWKRVKKSVRPKRDEEEFEKAKEEIGELRERQRNGEIDIYHFDGCGFDLRPTVPYAWQPKGETIEVRASHGSSRINVLGFLNTENNDFHCFEFECSANSAVMVAVFDWFGEKTERTLEEEGKNTMVILDNAPVHTSDEFLENIERWEDKGLFLYYIPPYSPELNLIEILWRFIKYLWLPFSAYDSFENLKRELDKILGGIGSEHQIVFS